jgi:hypothetical protein
MLTIAQDMDYPQFEHHCLQQVHPGHCQIPYVILLSTFWRKLTATTDFPIFLTTWHLVFATVMTQFLARFTTILDSRKKVPMTGRVYLRAIVPIGLFFSLSLICGNQAYLHLSVAFIQMLKVCADDNREAIEMLTSPGHDARRCPDHNRHPRCRPS